MIARFAILLVVSVVLPGPALAAQDSSGSDIAIIEKLMTRVGMPSQVAIDRFRSAGMQSISNHDLSTEEQTKVKSALMSLPAISKRMLERKLRSLSFVDGIPGAGTGLTSYDDKTGLYDITLRASIINESLSDFLATKEQRVFTQDGSGTTVAITGRGVDGVTYVLLHESSHVLDKSCGVTMAPHSLFARGIWLDDKNMVPPLEKLIPKTLFRGPNAIPEGKASAVYDELTQTPFVSLYATASLQEDFAETLAWYEIVKRHDGDLLIEVKNAREQTVKRWHPLESEDVRKRFSDLDALLQSNQICHGMR